MADDLAQLRQLLQAGKAVGAQGERLCFPPLQQQQQHGISGSNRVRLVI
jgi:hypothetical protein